jgi:hypothetical protein
MFRRAPLDADLNAEIASHIEAAIEENISRGLGPEEARRQALLRFGGVARSMEQHRDSRGLPALEIAYQDVCFSLRTLRRDRSLAFIVIAVLALGIGANVAVFSVVNAILLRPLPFRDRAGGSGFPAMKERPACPTRLTRSRHSRNSGVTTSPFRM